LLAFLTLILSVANDPDCQLELITIGNIDIRDKVFVAWRVGFGNGRRNVGKLAILASEWAEYESDIEARYNLEHRDSAAVEKITRMLAVYRRNGEKDEDWYA
jgi:hypothetical protein